MPETYTTKAGDTFDLVAFRVMGDCRYMPQLIDANRDKIDRFVFAAGVELTIPDVTPSTRPSSLPPWRR